MRAPMLTECCVCGDLIEVGDAVVWDPKLPKYRTTRHAGCTPPSNPCEATAALGGSGLRGGRCP